MQRHADFLSSISDTLSDPSSCAQVIAPGLVFMKQVLSPEQQVWLARYAMGAGTNGFYLPSANGSQVSSSTDGGDADQAENNRVLNSDNGKRGRIYDDIEHFPDSHTVRTLCHSLVNCAQRVDGKMPSMDPTHLLLLYYASDDGMEWHSDSDVNDGNTCLVACVSPLGMHVTLDSSWWAEPNRA